MKTYSHWNLVIRRHLLCLILLLPIPSLAVSIANISLNSTSIPRYGKLEATFDVTTSASRFYYPYAAADDGYAHPQGITVEARVTRPDSTTITVPAFYYVPYRRVDSGGQEILGISGPPKWTVRYAPNQTGNHTFVLVATDSSGTVQSASQSFNVTTSTNRGFVHKYASDPRFMVYDNGEGFIPLSKAHQWAPDGNRRSLSYGEAFATDRTNGVNLTRMWDQNDGFNLALEGSYIVWTPGWSQFSQAVGIDTSTRRSGNRAARFSRSSGAVTDGYYHRVAVLPNTSYTLRGYIKVSNISGTGAFLTAGASAGNNPGSSYRTSVRTGTSDWTLVSVTFTTTASETHLGIWAGAQSSTGTAWFDDLELIQSGQTWNVLSDPGFERHFLKDDAGNDADDPTQNLTVPKGTYINQWAAYQLDQILDSAAANGIAVQLCSHGDVYWSWDAVVYGETWATQNGFQVGWTDSRHLGYWKRNYRYRLARWGYSPGVLAWEVWNEHGNIPSGTGEWDFYSTFGAWVHTNDPHQHLFTTSMGSQAYTPDFWANNPGNLDVPNYHDYITTQLARHPIYLTEDCAYFVYYHAQWLISNWPTGAAKKPWVWGEIGTLTTWDNSDPVATTGTGGQITRHNFLWAGMFGQLFTHPIDWQGVDAGAHTKAARTFFNGEPYHTAGWANYATADVNPPAGFSMNTTQPKLRVFAIRKSTGDGLLAWCQHKDHTWAKVARDGVIPNPITGSFTSPSLNAGNYRREWWNTYSGTIISSANFSHGGGAMTISLPQSITDDIALKIIFTAPPDTTAPGAVTNLTVSSVTTSSATLLWTSPGDDGYSGTATSYDARYSTANITAANFASATQASGEPVPAAAGNSQSFTINGLAANTTYYFAIKTSDEAGNVSPLSNVPSRTTAGSLPSPWQNRDIGTVGVAGSASYSSGTFTVNGSGADIWDTADAFHFVYQTLSGDGEIKARVVTIGNTDPWAKAGVMFRESFAANSKHAFMLLSSSNGLAFQRRTSTGGTSTNTAGGTGPAPKWVRVVRSGGTFTAYSSTDGSAWTTVGSDTISMSNSVVVGLAVTAHNNAAVNTSTFDNVAVIASTPAVAVSFSGATNSYAAVNDAAVLDIAGSAMTMEAWVKVTALPATGKLGVVIARELGGSSGYALLIGDNGRVQVRLGTSANNWFQLDSTAQTWTSGTWYHLAASYDAANVRIFRNGTQIASAACTGTLLAGANKLYFGGYRYDWNPTDFLNAVIDEIRLSKIARYTGNFTAPTAPFINDANTVGLWRLNENTGTTAADSSGNGLTATLTGATWASGKF
jgi:hypothetical protein